MHGVACVDWTLNRMRVDATRAAARLESAWKFVSGEESSAVTAADAPSAAAAPDHVAAAAAVETAEAAVAVVGDDDGGEGKTQMVIDVHPEWKAMWGGRTKTYRYIAITACLAKADNPEVDALALQQNDSDRAYNARSLCHDVLVTFEQRYLEGAIGNSMEPFLNKPARFANLHDSAKSARDKKSHGCLVRRLSALATCDDACQALHQLLALVREQMQVNCARRQLATDNGNSSGGSSVADIASDDDAEDDPAVFLEHFLSRSCGGATAVATVGALERLQLRRLRRLPCGSGGGDGDQADDDDDDAARCPRVCVHHVNQSGDSSRQIADIDVRQGDTYLYGIEVKDRPFLSKDVAHFAQRLAEYPTASQQPRTTPSRPWGVFIAGIHAKEASLHHRPVYAERPLPLVRVRVVPLRAYIDLRLEDTTTRALRIHIATVMKEMSASDACWAQLHASLAAMRRPPNPAPLTIPQTRDKEEPRTTVQSVVATMVQAVVDAGTQNALRAYRAATVASVGV